MDLDNRLGRKPNQQFGLEGFRTELAGGEVYQDILSVAKATDIYLRVFGKPESGRLHQTISAHAAFLSEYTQVFTDHGVSVEKVLGVFSLLGKLVDGFDLREIKRDDVLLHALDKSLSSQSSEDFSRSTIVYLHIQKRYDDFEAQLRELPFASTGVEERLPEDHLRVLAQEDRGFAQVEEGDDPFARIRENIAHLENPEHQEIINSMLLPEPERAMAQWTPEQIEEAKEKFREVMGYPKEKIRRNGNVPSISGSLDVLRSIVQEHPVTSMREFFGRLEAAHLTEEELKVLLYFSGFYHAAEPVRIFGLNERMSSYRVQVHLRRSIGKLQEHPSSELYPSLDAISRRLSALEGENKGERVTIPPTDNERLQEVFAWTQKIAPDVLAAKITHPDEQRIVRAVMEMNERGVELTRVGLFTFMRDNGYGYSKRINPLSSDILRVLEKLLDEKRPRVGGRLILDTSLHSLLIQHEPTEGEMALIRSLRLRTHGDEPIYETVLQAAKVKNSGVYGRLDNQKLQEMAVSRRVVEGLAIIFGYKITNKLVKEARSVVFRVLGMRLGLEPEVYVSSQKNWEEPIKAALRAALLSDEEPKALASRLGCSIENLLTFVDRQTEETFYAKWRTRREN